MGGVRVYLSVWTVATRHQHGDRPSSRPVSAHRQRELRQVHGGAGSGLPREEARQPEQAPGHHQPGGSSLDYEVRESRQVKATESKFEMDKQFEEVTADGRKVMTTMKVTAPNTVYQEMLGTSGGKDSFCTREF